MRKVTETSGGDAVISVGGGWSVFFILGFGFGILILVWSD